VELMSGKISVDGVDISKIGLSDLRRHLSIIPQVSHAYFKRRIVIADGVGICTGPSKSVYYSWEFVSLNEDVRIDYFSSCVSDVFNDYHRDD
jgi:ABC-type cobalamin/Fe3+-siderophores transport system ATPase subunit